MTKQTSGFAQQIREEKATLRKLKRCAPWMLNEYLELESSRKGYEAARERFAKARAAWNSVGA